MSWRELGRVLLGRGGVVRVGANGQSARVKVRDISDLTVLIEIFCHHIYLIKASSEEKVVMDVGSYVGYFAIYCLLWWPQAKIICFEPDKESYLVLIDNLRLNHKLTQRVKVFNWGLGSETKRVVFYHYPFASHNSLYRFYPPESESRVKLHSIGEELRGEKRVDLLKIDTEGAEYEILYSLGKRELGKIGRMLVETHELAGERENVGALKIFMRRYYRKVKEEGRMVDGSRGVGSKKYEVEIRN